MGVAGTLVTIRGRTCATREQVRHHICQLPRFKHLINLMLSVHMPQILMFKFIVSKQFRFKFVNEKRTK